MEPSQLDPGRPGCLITMLQQAYLDTFLPRVFGPAINEVFLHADRTLSASLTASNVDLGFSPHPTVDNSDDVLLLCPVPLRPIVPTDELARLLGRSGRGTHQVSAPVATKPSRLVVNDGLVSHGCLRGVYEEIEDSVISAYPSTVADHLACPLSSHIMDNPDTDWDMECREPTVLPHSTSQNELAQQTTHPFGPIGGPQSSFVTPPYPITSPAPRDGSFWLQTAHTLESIRARDSPFAITTSPPHPAQDTFSSNDETLVDSPVTLSMGMQVMCGARSHWNSSPCKHVSTIAGLQFTELRAHLDGAAHPAEYYIPPPDHGMPQAGKAHHNSKVRSRLCPDSQCMCRAPHCKQRQDGEHRAHVQDLSAHWKTQHLHYTWYCDLCQDVAWTSSFALERHRKRCKKNSVTKRRSEVQRRAQIREHGGCEPSRCTSCGTLFVSTAEHCRHIVKGYCFLRNIS